MIKMDTPWIEWVATNKIKGVSAASMLLEMAKAGFDEQTSLKIISNIHKLPLYDIVKKLEEEKLELQSQIQNLQKPVYTNTQPALYLSKDKFFGDVLGQSITISCKVSSPDIFMATNFISETERVFLLDIAKTKLKASKVIDNNTGESIPHTNRTSSGMSFQRGENKVIADIEDRISRLVQWPVEKGEGIQVLKYDVGQQYKPHYDYFIPDQPSTDIHVKKGGQRIATLIMYLSTPEEGGFTEFPNLNLRFPAVAGNVLFFSYPDANSKDTLHSGTPVVKGEKYIATKWLREKTYD